MRDLFEDMIEKLLAEVVTPELIASSKAGGWPETLWSALEGQGVPLAASPEERGGVGGSWLDAFVLVRAAGRHAAPAPVAEAIAANWLLGFVGLDAVEGIPTIGHTTDGRLSDSRFSGVLLDVPWGRSASHVVTIVTVPDPMLVLLPAGSVTVQGANIACEPRDSLSYDAIEVIAAAPLTAGLSADAVLLCGAMIRAAQIAGALQGLLDMIVDYANQREQFGRAIGKFQAVQHRIAVLSQQAALASSAAETAFALSEAGPRDFAVAAAKSAASEAAGEAASIAHAVMGAIGFTHEHSLHLTTRRLWSWRSEFGGQALWAQRIGAAVCRRGADGFWPAFAAGAVMDLN